MESKYFENFWDPRSGHTVFDAGGNRLTLHTFNERYPEQVEIKENDKIYYLQDLSWEPTLQDLDNVLRRLGLSKVFDGWRFKDIFFPNPTDATGYSNLIKSFRAVSFSFLGEGL